MPIIPCTMEARKLLYTAMVIAPAVLMAGIGVHARTYVDPFQWSDSTDDHKRISAYIPYISEAADTSWRSTPGAEAHARRLAMVLIEGKEAGRLKPLVPISADELTPSGHKGNIYEVATSVARFLILEADRRIAEGNYREAATDLILASESLSPLKYSEFTSLFRCTLQQGNILHRFMKIYPHVDEETRKELAACMEKMKGDRTEFVRIARTAKRIILKCFGEKQSTEQALLTATNLVPEASFFERPALAKERPVTSTEPLDLAFEIPNQRLEAEQCVLADARNRAMIAQIMTLPTKRVSL